MHVPSCHLWPDQLYNTFPRYVINGMSLRTRYWTQKVCSDFPYNFYLKHFSFKEEMSEIWRQMHIGLHVKYPLFLWDFNETWIFATYFRKTVKYQISWKFILWGAELFHADGWTDRHDEANSRFSQFCEAPPKQRLLPYTTLTDWFL